ncbi:MAG: cysteine desulfurase family protein, partial [bacterium]
MAEPEIIYLDHAAATPLRPEAAEAMATAYREAPGNPSSIGGPGRAAARALGRARERLALALDVLPERVIFTSGGTESIGLAVLGSLQGRRGHVVTSAIEHPAVLGSVRLLERQGFEVTRVPVSRGGVVDVDRFAGTIRKDTLLACLMHVNNELGTIQPVAEVFAAVKAQAPRCLTFADAVQSFTRLAVEPDRWQADLVALSSHKIGGPRGVGALVAGSRRPEPLYGGGDQEWGVRPGTEDVPGIVGFVAAARACLEGLDRRRLQSRMFSEELAARLEREVPTARRNGDDARRVDFIVSVSVPGLPSEALVRGLEEHGVCVSTGAACHARSQKQSHVL